jgi:SPP1 family predicted phage head-tail adaptor
MQPGRLNHRLVLQSRSTTLDSVGGQSTTWTPVATVWAAIQPLSGRDLIAAQASQSEISHRITLRYQALFADPKAVAALRAVYGSRIFDIHAAMNQDENNHTLVLMASEGMNDG